MKNLFICLSILFSMTAFAQEVEIKSEYHYHNFGRVFLHSSNYARFRISNDQTTPAVLQGFYNYGMDFRAQTDCPRELTQGQHCYLEIEFFPMREGYQTGRVEMIYQDGNNIYIDLAGDAYKL